MKPRERQKTTGGPRGSAHDDGQWTHTGSANDQESDARRQKRAASAQTQGVGRVMRHKEEARAAVFLQDYFGHRPRRIEGVIEHQRQPFSTVLSLYLEAIGTGGHPKR
jgi:hypothetical protein